MALGWRRLLWMILRRLLGLLLLTGAAERKQKMKQGLRLPRSGGGALVRRCC